MEEKLSIPSLIDQLSRILMFAYELEERHASALAAVDERYRESARNLLHYLALRHQDITDLQTALSELGISSLQHAEPHVLANLQSVLTVLRQYLHQTSASRAPALTIRAGKQLRDRHCEALLGKLPEGRPSIMVTFPSEAADDYGLVRDMLAAGMNCARINCAKDDAPAWQRMIDHVRRAEEETDRSCKVLMDLCGPKIRTGAVAVGPRLVRIRPQRNMKGETEHPATVWLTPSVDIDSEYVEIPVDKDWLAYVQTDDTVRFWDTRGHLRTTPVTEVDDTEAYISLDKVAYLETGTQLELIRDEQTIATTVIGKLLHRSLRIYLKQGDTLILHRDPRPGEPAQYDKEGALRQPAHIACTLPEVFHDVAEGQSVHFDDGKIVGKIRQVSEEELTIEITYAKNEERALKKGKGINFPDTDLHVSGLTQKDIQDLDFVAQHADIVNLSFVRKPEEVNRLLEELRQRNASDLAIMLKIETRRGVENLPWLLLAAMQTYPVGVMIARGDLAIEMGWEELAVLQEEIRWLCQAAHVPHVWATQVLEGLAKKGLPKRAEITDAALAERADCIMLNKGDYILEAIDMLKRIACRIEKQEKKNSTLVQQLSF